MSFPRYTCRLFDSLFFLACLSRDIHAGCLTAYSLLHVYSRDIHAGSLTVYSSLHVSPEIYLTAYSSLYRLSPSILTIHHLTTYISIIQINKTDYTELDSNPTTRDAISRKTY